MSTIVQKEFQRAQGTDGNVTYARYSKRVTLTMTAGAQQYATAVIPRGAVLDNLKSEVETAFSGTPTNIYLRVGSAVDGQEVVADVDIKAQAHTTLTTVASFANVSTAASADRTIYLRLTANGGTNPAGTADIFINYLMPKP